MNIKATLSSTDIHSVPKNLVERFNIPNVIVQSSSTVLVSPEVGDFTADELKKLRYSPLLVRKSPIDLSRTSLKLPLKQLEQLQETAIGLMDREIKHYTMLESTPGSEKWILPFVAHDRTLYTPYNGRSFSHFIDAFKFGALDEGGQFFLGYAAKCIEFCIEELAFLSFCRKNSLFLTTNDVKPNNMTIGNGGINDRSILKRVDVACAVTEEEFLASPDGVPFRGTPLYAAPERVLDGDIAPQSDVYSIGIILFDSLLQGDRRELIQSLLYDSFEKLKAPSQLPSSFINGSMHPAIKNEYGQCLDSFLSPQPHDRPPLSTSISILQNIREKIYGEANVPLEPDAAVVY